jgi:hypothetical protein
LKLKTGSKAPRFSWALEFARFDSSRTDTILGKFASTVRRNELSDS